MRILLASQTGDLIAPLRKGAEGNIRQILTCPTAGEILEELGQAPGPRIVILEGQTDKYDPQQLCRDIRRLPIEDYCYVLVILDSDSNCDDFFQAGADDCIRPPVTAQRLGGHLQAALRVTQLNAQLSEIHRSAPVAMVLLDAGGQVKQTNPAVDRLLKSARGKAATPLAPCLESLTGQAGCGKSENCRGCQAHAVLQNALQKEEFHERQPVAVPPQVPLDERMHLLISTAPITVGHAPMILVSLEDISSIWKSRRRLQKTIAQLKAFNRLAVGRELQMVELKRRINQLHRRCGEEAPYDIDFAGPEPSMDLIDSQ